MEKFNTAVYHARQHEVMEWGYTSHKVYDDPFHQVELDLVATYEDGTEWTVPAYWAGGHHWRVRFAPPVAGKYQLATVCSDEKNEALHRTKTALLVAENPDKKSLQVRGALQVAKSRRTLEYADGQPFFWLGDTWWMGLSRRLRWPEAFQQLTADRVQKKFTVIQIVAGLYPDVPDGFDWRSANEAGFAWEADYSRLNPAYFDMADLRIRWLVRQGLVPCIVGSWGYYALQLGPDKMKKHWRNLIARWSAYPVVWCIAGEGVMPYYLSESKSADAQRQRVALTVLGKYIRQVDPYKRLITIHPTQTGRDQVEDDSVLDFEMLQTGHGGFNDAANIVSLVRQEVDRRSAMPVIVGEANYEGIIHATQDEVQRLSFWTALLNGAAGYTYGANGIWQVNQKDEPFGASPHGGTWGNTSWEEAAQLLGSTQLGKARQLLERYPWYQFEPHPDWVEPSGSPEQVGAPFAAGIPGKVRVIYLYQPVFPWATQPAKVLGLEPEMRYRAYYWNPRTGEEHSLGELQAGRDHSWLIPVQPEMKDWVLILEAGAA